MVRFAGLSPEEVKKCHIHYHQKKCEGTNGDTDIFLHIAGREKSFIAFADSAAEKREWCLKLCDAMVATQAVTQGRRQSVIDVMTGGVSTENSKSGTCKKLCKEAAIQEELSDTDDEKDDDDDEQNLDIREDDIVAPIIVIDKTQKRCLLCNEKFNLIHRHYYCRNCGIIVCSNCSRSRRWCVTIFFTHSRYNFFMKIIGQNEIYSSI